jgi:hypothetical protein
MNSPKDFENRREELEKLLDEAAEDAQLKEALKNFRLSVQAWSEAELSRPRTAIASARHWSWRLATGWALGCVLVIGGASGAIFERHQKRVEQARIAAADREATRQRELAMQRARAEEDQLLAKVNSDVSRDVPDAMEPLAQLMDDSGNQ